MHDKHDLQKTIKKHFLNTFLLLGLIGIIFPFNLQVANAELRKEQLDLQVANDFIVQPSKIEVFGNPGDIITKDISITSRISGTTQFRIELEDFVGLDETTQGEGTKSPIRLLGNDESPFSLKRGIFPEATEFNLGMGEKITIPVTIKIPADAAPGGFYTSVIVSNAPSKEAEQSNTSGAKAISRVGALVFVRVNGQANEAGNVEQFFITPSHWFYTPGNLTFQMLFANTGNVHLAPYGEITVKALFGSEKAKLPINAFYSLPLSKRYQSINLDTSSMFGRYTATLVLNKSLNNPGAGNNLETMTVSFWVIPWTLILGIFLVILLILFIISYTKSYIKRNYVPRQNVDGIQ